MAELVRWSRDSLWPNYQLPTGLALANVSTAMVTQDYEAVLLAARDPIASGGGGLPPFGKYGIRHSPPAATAAERILLPKADGAKLEDVSLWYIPDHLPRTWIVHEVEVLPPLERNDPQSIHERTREVFWPQGPQEEKGSGFGVQGSGFGVQGSEFGNSPRPLAVDGGRPNSSPRPLAGEGPGVRVAGSKTPSDNQPRDLRRTAVIETASPAESFQNAPGDPANSETCQIVRYESLQVEIQAELKHPGLVILCDQFYPGWTLDVTTPGEPTYRAPILRTNRVMRGVWLQPGSHRLVYRYRPASFLVGATISILASLGLVALAAMRRVRCAQ
jgi:hypothetical protein